MLLQDGQHKGSSAAADAQSMECASALAAVSALATGLGAFLAPQLPRMLLVLLDGRVLAESASGIAASAAAARETLTKTVPPRLLLPSLYAHLSSALQVCYCHAPSCCMLGSHVMLLPIAECGSGPISHLRWQISSLNVHSPRMWKRRHCCSPLTALWPKWKWECSK